MFERGSEWRKWDLHLHTPSSRLNQQFGNDWETYLDTLAKLDFAVYGITNYFCFVDDELERVRNGLRSRGSEQTVLGNIEFRIDQPNKNDEFINVHVLFAEHLSSKQINDAIARLRLVNSADSRGDQRIYCCDSDVTRAGLDFSKVLVNFKDLVDHLKANLNPQDYLVACCPSGYGSFRPAARDGRGAHLAIEIDKGCQVLFGGETDRDFFLGTERFDGASQKPVLAGSDAHEFAKLGTRFCWIKANPTFDGLRQTVFEPADRVSLSLATDPRNIYPKPSFSKISANGSIVDGEPLSFDRVELSLNQGLVTVIGGRGSGKSVLLDCLYKQFRDPTSVTSDSRLRKITPKQFGVTFRKQSGDEEVAFDNPGAGAVTYLHVRQGDIRKLAEAPDALSDEIKKLLGISSGMGTEDIELDLESVLEQMADVKRWIQQEDEQGNRINSNPFNQQIIQVNEERLKAITSKENKELVEKYNKNAGSHAALTRVQQRLVGLNAKLTQYANDLSREIRSINEVLGSNRPTISEIDISGQAAQISTIQGALQDELQQLTHQNAEIQRQLKEQGIEQDPAGLLDKVAVFQKAATDARQRIQELETRKQTFRELLERRRQMAASVIEALRREKHEIALSFERLKGGKEGWEEQQIKLVQRLLADVTIEGQIIFDSSAFYAGISRILDGRRFRQSAAASQYERIATRIGVKSFEDFVKLLDGQAILTADDGSKINVEQFANQKEYFIPRDEYSFLDYIFLPRWQQQYLRVRALLRYKNKDPEKLSVGQRGTFYICIKLATDPFGSAFVFDQPEDDLDNEFIVRELVPLFREIKKYRQIIVATHNANLVVNADAEQIVLAENTDELLSYASGALEDKAIREAVCTILEGGEDAFLKRESKYSFAG
jgi:ABC-type lipoprotein export system ATPase subunit